MKKPSILLILWLILIGLLLLQGCGSAPQAPNVADSSNRNGKPDSGNASVLNNSNQPISTDDSSFAPSPSCGSIKAIATENLTEICRKIRPATVEALRSQGKLLPTLKELNTKIAGGRLKIENVNEDPDVKAALPANTETLQTADSPSPVKNNLSSEEISQIAEKTAEIVKTSHQQQLGTERQNIIEQVQGDARRLFIFQIVVLLLITAALAVAGWWHTRAQFSLLGEKIDSDFKPRGVGTVREPPATASGNTEIEHLQKYLESLLNQLSVNQTKETKNLFSDLKKTIISTMGNDKPETKLPSDVPASSAHVSEYLNAPVSGSTESLIKELVKGEKTLSVDDYKDYFRQDAKILTLDRYGDKLIDGDENGEFLLIAINRNMTQGMVIPNYQNFSKPEIFSNYYQNYYERIGSQTIGDVLITRPAICSFTEGGWQLKQAKGELEIR